MKQKTKHIIICQYCDTSHSTMRQDEACLMALLKRSRFVDYRIFFRDESHPLAKIGISARRSGLVDLARHLVSVRRGSWLRSGEIVHFVDGNVENFAAKNLQVVTRSQLNGSLLRQPGVKTNCAVCNTPFSISQSHLDRRVTCSVECRAIWQKHFDVPADELLLLVWDHPTTEVAEMFGVSDKAIQKRCDKFGLRKPPPGYWTLIKGGADHTATLLRLKWSQEEIEALDQRIMDAENRMKTIDGIAVSGDTEAITKES